MRVSLDLLANGGRRIRGHPRSRLRVQSCAVCSSCPVLLDSRSSHGQGHVTRCSVWHRKRAARQPGRFVDTSNTTVSGQGPYLPTQNLADASVERAPQSSSDLSVPS
ncbi:unnamed protein product [Ixodes persulcatus]